MNRRDFFKDTAAASMTLAALGLTAEELRAQAAKPAYDDKPTGRPVNVGVIGMGRQGREMLATMPRLGILVPVAVCDIYPAFLKRGQEAAPKAKAYDDYRKLLEDKSVEGVLIATPSHQHKEIALAALQAGKHVYCEAPLAHTVEDAQTIARAALAVPKQVFQAGLYNRVHPQYHHVNNFVRAGVLDKVTACRAQWHKKTSWRLAAPSPEREHAVNWRLAKATSPGLMGEIGIHSLDTMSWFLRQLPVSVMGFGSVMLYNDGRDVPDTVQCLVEYPDKVHLSYDATLTNSFDGTYELLQGAHAAVVLRGERAWLVKEADAPLLGWEVYARKEKVGDDVGVALVADASKLIAIGKEPGKDGYLDPGKTLLYYALEAFLKSVQENKPSDAGPLVAYQATMVGLKANEAVASGTKIEFKQEWFTLG